MTTSLHEPDAAEVGRLLREARLTRGEELAAAAEWSARRAPTPGTSALTAPSSRDG
jgi:hypothetical protein